MNYQINFQSLISWLISHGIKVIVILFAAWLATRISKALIKKSAKIARERSKTLSKVFTSTIKVIIWVIAILTILPEFGVNPAPLLAGAGLVGLAIGMGAKNLIQDYLAGLFILLEDQYRVGEEVNIDGKEGKVLNLSLRRTVIRNSDGVISHIPNGQIKFASNLSRK